MGMNALALLNALMESGKMSRDTALDLYNQYREDEKESSEHTAMEKLEQAIEDMETE